MSITCIPGMKLYTKHPFPWMQIEINESYKVCKMKRILIYTLKCKVLLLSLSINYKTFMYANSASKTYHNYEHSYNFIVHTVYCNAVHKRSELGPVWFCDGCCTVVWHRTLVWISFEKSKKASLPVRYLCSYTGIATCSLDRNGCGYFRNSNCRAVELQYL